MGTFSSYQYAYKIGYRRGARFFFGLVSRENGEFGFGFLAKSHIWFWFVGKMAWLIWFWFLGKTADLVLVSGQNGRFSKTCPPYHIPPLLLRMIYMQGFSGGGARMPARSVCLVTLSLSEAGPGRFGRQASVTDIYHAMPCHAMPCETSTMHHTRSPTQNRIPDPLS